MLSPTNNQLWLVAYIYSNYITARHVIKYPPAPLTALLCGLRLRVLPVLVPALCGPYSHARCALALGALPRGVLLLLFEQLVQRCVEVLERGVLRLQQVSPGVGRS